MPTTIPHDDPTLHNQVAPSEISDDAFREAYAAPRITCCQRFGQVLLFIFTLGWLRLLLLVVGTIVWMIFMLPIVICSSCPRAINCLHGYGIFMQRCYNRWLLLCFGIIWIRIRGKRDKSARNYVYNHTSLCDGPLVFSKLPFTVIVAAGAKKVPFFGAVLLAGKTIFIDRSHAGGNAQAIVDCMDDFSRLPVAIAPEGKISNGSILFKFRTGGFIANQPVQPITLRYHMIWNVCGCTLNWVCDGLIEFLWGVFCVPFTIVTLTYLDTVLPSDTEGMSPDQKAQICQLMMANSLGSLAINRSSREIFVEQPLLQNEEHAPPPQQQ